MGNLNKAVSENLVASFSALFGAVGLLFVLAFYMSGDVRANTAGQAVIKDIHTFMHTMSTDMATIKEKVSSLEKKF